MGCPASATSDALQARIQPLQQQSRPDCAPGLVAPLAAERPAPDDTAAQDEPGAHCGESSIAVSHRPGAAQAPSPSDQAAQPAAAGLPGAEGQAGAFRVSSCSSLGGQAEGGREAAAAALRRAPSATSLRAQWQKWVAIRDAPCVGHPWRCPPSPATTAPRRAAPVRPPRRLPPELPGINFVAIVAPHVKLCECDDRHAVTRHE